MTVRKAKETDIGDISQIYSDIHTAEENGEVTIGWIRGIYPTEQTAIDSLKRDDLFVMEDNGKIVGAAIINQCQVDVYADAMWEYKAKAEEVMVLHTLVISPKSKGKGYGKAFVAYYENYAKGHNCPYLRMDTNERNINARKLYKKLGYREADVIPCDFNGIKGVNMVLLEKYIG